MASPFKVKAAATRPRPARDPPPPPPPPPPALKLSPGEQPFEEAPLARAQRLQTEGLALRQASPEHELMEKARLLGFGDQPVMRPVRAELVNAVTTAELRRLRSLRVGLRSVSGALMTTRM